MFNFNSVNKKALTWIAAIIGLLLVLSVVRSGYSPRPLVIKQTGEYVGKSLFNLPYTKQCAPGPKKESSAYTLGLKPGGICGAQQLVREQADYEIEDGIGGTLI